MGKSRGGGRGGNASCWKILVLLPSFVGVDVCGCDINKVKMGHMSVPDNDCGFIPMLSCRLVWV